MSLGTTFPTTVDTDETLGIHGVPGQMGPALEALKDAVIAAQTRLGISTESRVVQITQVALTAAQVNALAATQQTLVAAQGAGTAIVPLGLLFFLDHGGTDFVQAAGTDALAIKYAGGAEIQEVATEAQMTALLEASADALLLCPITSAVVPTANAALQLDNNGASEYTTGNGVLYVTVIWTTMPTGVLA